MAAAAAGRSLTAGVAPVLSGGSLVVPYWAVKAAAGVASRAEMTAEVAAADLVVLAAATLVAAAQAEVGNPDNYQGDLRFLTGDWLIEA